MKEKFNGWRGISDSFNILVAIPSGHGRIHDKASMAYEAQIEDMAYIPEVLESAGFKIVKKYAGGINMGAICKHFFYSFFYYNILIKNRFKLKDFNQILTLF